MSTAPLTIPRPVPVQRIRPPKKNIPQTVEERNSILKFVRNYVAEHKPVPPMPLPELKVHADKLIEMLGLDPIYRDYIGVLMNNELWRETLAAIPFERRLLLLPKCLRIESKCPAPFDEFGLLCKQCGLCTIQDFQEEAEKLGYAVLVAEGSAIVMSLIQTGKIDAIVGVSCISVLERAFPYMEAAAIPGVAVPLLQDDCIDTTVDIEWIWDYIHLTTDDRTRRLDLTSLRDEVDSWFTRENLAEIMGSPEGETESIAHDWLGRAGKRWRPFLTVSTFEALRDDIGEALPDDLRKIAVAIECFHKASLIHDDIEDEDAERYGEKTLHEEHGIPVALNVGDLLIGEGYRLIGDSNISAEQRAKMLQVATSGQRQLCRGQGAELCWARSPAPLKVKDVLQIFQQKTAPAFEVALRLGAVYSGKHEAYSDVLGAYSEALGVAYQIRDDLNDLGLGEESTDIEGLRPSILLAIAHERARGDDKPVLEALWKREPVNGTNREKVEELYVDLKADEKAKSLLESYKEQAIRSLADIDNANLKGLLRRVIGKIFNDAEIKGWCGDFQEQREVATLKESEPALAQ